MKKVYVQTVISVDESEARVYRFIAKNIGQLLEEYPDKIEMRRRYKSQNTEKVPVCAGVDPSLANMDLVKTVDNLFEIALGLVGTTEDETLF